MQRSATHVDGLSVASSNASRDMYKKSVNMADEKGTKQQDWRAEGGKNENTENKRRLCVPPSVLDATMEGLGTRFTRLCVVATNDSSREDKVGLHQNELIKKARLDVEQ